MKCKSRIIFNYPAFTFFKSIQVKSLVLVGYFNMIKTFAFNVFSKFLLGFVFAVY